MQENEVTTEPIKPKVKTGGTNKQKKLRGFSRGVSDNRSVRMVTMAAPICPNSVVQMEIRDGKPTPKPQDPAKPNCQAKAWEKIGYPWWEDCEKAGHDPYYTTKFYTVSEPVWKEVNGEPVLDGMKTVWKADKYLNTVQVAQGIRHNSAKGVRRARKVKGRKFLSEVGHVEVCQYRNCQEPVDFHFRSKRFGDYCGQRHYQLAAANEKGELLHQNNTGLLLGIESQIASKREEQLQRAGAFDLDR